MRYGIFIYVLIIMSCQSRVDMEGYKNLLDQSQLVQTIETDSFSYKLKLLPSKLMALKNENMNALNFNEVWKDLALNSHFQLEIEDKYPERMKRPSTSMYYLTDFQHSLSLNQDNLMTYYHHEASHIKGKETFLFGFANQSHADLTVTIKKHIMDVNLKFTFPNEEILKFENMELKI